MKKIFSKVFTALIYAEIGILAVAAPIVLSVVLCLLVYWLIAEIVCLLFTAFIVFFGMTFLASLINPLFFILWIGLSVVGFGWLLHSAMTSAIDDIKKIYLSQKEA